MEQRLKRDVPRPSNPSEVWLKGTPIKVLAYRKDPDGMKVLIVRTDWSRSPAIQVNAEDVERS